MADGLQDLFSEAVRAVERRGDVVDDSLLWPEEGAHLGRVVEGRRRDFVNGRWCARRAMTALGREPEPVLVGADRQPLWPSGLVGSITHTDGYAAAAVGIAPYVVAIGIDAEPDEPLPEKILGRVGLDTEIDWARDARPGMGVVNADRLLFCAKEAIYKAWYPVTGRWLGFSEARVSFDDAEGAFEAVISADGPLSVMTGRYASVGGVLLTAVELRPGAVGGVAPTPTRT